MGQRHAPAALYPRKRPGTHCTGGWVGPRAGLDRCGKSRPHPRFDPRTVQPVASRYTDYATRPTHRDVRSAIRPERPTAWKMLDGPQSLYGHLENRKWSNLGRNMVTTLPVIYRPPRKIYEWLVNSVARTWLRLPQFLFYPLFQFQTTSRIKYSIILRYIL